jgi:hypothetical protein
MRHSHSRLAFFLLPALLVLATQADAQYGGGRSRDRGGESGAPRTPRPDQANPRAAAPVVSDPMAAIERELPSLRIDLKLSADQAPLFDAFERKVRDATAATRNRLRQLSSFRLDDGSTVSAASIVGTIAGVDAERAEAMRGVNEKMDALYASFSADQRKQFDRRIMQSQREPLGLS